MSMTKEQEDALIRAVITAIYWDTDRYRPQIRQLNEGKRAAMLKRAQIVIDAYKAIEQSQAEEQARLLKLEQEQSVRQIQEKLERASQRLLSFSEEINQ